MASEHLQPGHTRNAALLDELGLTEFLAERFAVVGTSEECMQKVLAIQQAGVEVLHINPGGPSPEQTIDRFGREIIAKFR